MLDSLSDCTLGAFPAAYSVFVSSFDVAWVVEPSLSMLKSLAHSVMEVHQWQAAMAGCDAFSCSAQSQRLLEDRREKENKYKSFFRKTIFAQKRGFFGPILGIFVGKVVFFRPNPPKTNNNSFFVRQVLAISKGHFWCSSCTENQF